MMDRQDAFRVLVLGGYGVFGTWVVEALAGEPGISVTVAGRDPERARHVGEHVGRGRTAMVKALRLDVTDPALAARVAELDTDLVIHAAGPFQGQSYHVARSALEAGSHYLDLADGRAFVSGIAALDRDARARGLRVISGASSVPGLSSAVVAELAQGLAELESIEIAISPGNRAPRGEATVRAILGYTGRPFRRFERGRWVTVYGWQDLKRMDFGELGRRWVANCDVADLELFPGHFGAATVTFHAGLELRTLHFALWAMAALARVRLVADWARHTGPIMRLARRFERCGSDRGGMRVRLTGIDREGRARDRCWRLTAGSGHGPRIPAVPAIVLAKKLARGTLGGAGAGACLALFSLAEFGREIATLDVHQRIDNAPAGRTQAGVA